MRIFIRREKNPEHPPSAAPKKTPGLESPGVFTILDLNSASRI
jgi:hypothetical protein